MPNYQPRTTADMFESVNKKIEVHPLSTGFQFSIFQAPERGATIATVDHADIRGLVTA